MNHTIYSADRLTHLKVVVLALVAGIAVEGVSLTARWGSDQSRTQMTQVVKAETQLVRADKPVAITSLNAALVR